ncbi:MAG: trigger factor [Oscillospiraceae bacterium]|nr:trigger factor [Oscillospiraceae bacterium]
MNVKDIEKKEKSLVDFVVELGSEEFDKAVDEAYRKAKHSISIPGFRKGKVPRKVVEARYGAAVFYEDAINDVCPGAIEQAVQQEKLQVVGQPQMEILNVGKEGFSFKVSVPVYPQVHLRHYKGVAAVRPQVTIQPEDVEKELEPLQQRAGWLEPVERPLQEGDTAVIDYEGFDQGVPFEGGKESLCDLVIGSHTFVPGFEEQLVGMKIDEEKEIEVTFPEKYHANLAGKTVTFQVKLRDVKVKKLPQLDDEFAKDVSEFNTLEELKKDLAEKLLEKRKKIAEQTFENQVVRHVVDYMDADIPEAMVESRLNHMVEEFSMSIASQGMSLENYLDMTGKTLADLRNDTRGGALYQVQVDLALSEVARLEGIDSTPEEVDAEYERLAEEFSYPLEKLKETIQPENVKQDLKLRQATKFLIDNAVEQGEEPKPEAPDKEVVLTFTEDELEHHHHEEAQKKAADSASKSDPEAAPVKKPRKRSTKKASPAQEETAAKNSCAE